MLWTCGLWRVAGGLGHLPGWDVGSGDVGSGNRRVSFEWVVE